MTTVKSGRTVAAVRYDWKWKDPHDATETVVEYERHSTARRKDQTEPDAPPMIEHTPKQDDPARRWWESLTETERATWADKAGRTFEAGGRTIPRNDRDLARAAYELLASNRETQ
jgi:hypothetical protein